MISIHLISFRLFVFLDWDDVTDDSILFQSTVIHFCNFVHICSYDGDPVLVRLHHGLIRFDLALGNDLHETPSYKLSGVLSVVVDAHFPAFAPGRLSFLYLFL